MDKIDRLGWTAGISFISYGVRIGVRVTDARALDRLTCSFPPGWKPSSSPVVERLYSFVNGGMQSRTRVRQLNLLYGNVERLARSKDEQPLLEAFESDLHLFIAEAARRR